MAWNLLEFSAVYLNFTTLATISQDACTKYFYYFLWYLLWANKYLHIIICKQLTNLRHGRPCKMIKKYHV